MIIKNLRLAVVAAVILLCTSPIMAHAQISASEVIQRLGYPLNSKLLIIHGDDFGVAHSVDLAMEKALEKGWITSASIMVPCPWFPEVAQFAREHPEMDLGLHLTLTSEWIPYRWGPVSVQPVLSLRDKDGYFWSSEQKAAVHDKPADVAREIQAQIMMARAAGVQFTHFDTHMNTLLKTPELFRVYQQAGYENHVPILINTQRFGQHVKDSSIMSDGVIFSRQFEMHSGVPLDQWLATYKKMLSGLSPGLYVLTVHLGYDNDELRAITSGYPDQFDAVWRGADLKVVSSPEFHQFLKEQGFVLVTWRQVAKAEYSSIKNRP
jgi:predicted glycoside hydrolase/deacetylase ChbG (UPF0249 family)